jgi:hypothetical protein
VVPPKARIGAGERRQFTERCSMIGIRSVRLLGVVLVAVALVSATLLVRDSSAMSFPELIPLPDGWQPEGIVVGRPHDLLRLAGQRRDLRGGPADGRR